MGRRRGFAPLNVLMNNRLVGRLTREPGGAVSFSYAQAWLDWENALPVSLSLPLRDRATDGHAKNFSLALRPGGRYRMTPHYDVLTAQLSLDAKQIQHKAFRMAMSVGHPEL